MTLTEGTNYVDTIRVVLILGYFSTYILRCSFTYLSFYPHCIVIITVPPHRTNCHHKCHYYAAKWHYDDCLFNMMIVVVFIVGVWYSFATSYVHLSVCCWWTITFCSVIIVVVNDEFIVDGLMLLICCCLTFICSDSVKVFAICDWKKKLMLCCYYCYWFMTSCYSQPMMTSTVHIEESCVPSVIHQW